MEQYFIASEHGYIVTRSENRTNYIGWVSDKDSATAFASLPDAEMYICFMDQFEHGLELRVVS